MKWYLMKTLAGTVLHLRDFLDVILFVRSILSGMPLTKRYYRKPVRFVPERVTVFLGVDALGEMGDKLQ